MSTAGIYLDEGELEKLQAELREERAKVERWKLENRALRVAVAAEKTRGDSWHEEAKQRLETISIKDTELAKVLNKAAENWSKVEELSAEIERLRDMARRAQRVMIDAPGALDRHNTVVSKALYALTEAILQNLGYEPEQVRWLRSIDPSPRDHSVGPVHPFARGCLCPTEWKQTLPSYHAVNCLEGRAATDEERAEYAKMPNPANRRPTR